MRVWNRIKYWLMVHGWHRCIICGLRKHFSAMGDRRMGVGLICRECCAKRDKYFDKVKGNSSNKIHHAQEI